MASRDEYVKGVVLYSRPYKEKDRMIWFYSKNKGKILLFVRGGMKIDSKLAPMVSEPFALLNLKVVKGRAYFHLIGGEILEVFENIEKDYKRLLRLSGLFEKIERILPRGEENQKIFFLIKKFLNTINKSYRINIFSSFLLKLLSFSGFMPELKHCLVCKKDLDQGYFDLKKGGLVCKKHKSKKSFKVSKKTLKLLQDFLLKDFDYLLSKKFDKNASLKAKQIIESFYSWQV